ncbi:MAG: alpha/beta fold hydrolase [Bacteroidales bacterium]
MTVLSAQERMVRVDEHNFRIKTLGEGTISVLFESGMSDSLEVWGSIPDSVALHARVFLYDRLDIAKSDTSHTPRTLPNVVGELRSILQDQQINPPYILVGHSLGGLITRYFAANYPEEVKGLLLLDPAPEAYWKKMSPKELEEYRTGGTEWYNTRFPARYRKEWHAFLTNLGYMDSISLNKNLPVILVSATAWNWYKFQKPIIKGINNARQVELEGQHHIYKDHPEKVVGYIEELIRHTDKQK